MGGDYSAPVTIPIPNFVTVRSTEQTLAAMTQCHLVQGKPEEALRDLTLMHDLCRIMEGSHPMTLVSAMINVAVEGLYVNTMADDLRWHAWREPQLAALEQQLQQFNLLPPVRQSLEMEREFECRTLENAPRTGLREVFGITGKANSWKDRKQLFRTWLYPRGWVYQNIVTIAKLFPGFIASVDPASQIVFPDKLRDAGRELEAVFSHRSPYVFMAMQMTPNFNKALQRTAQNQTMVNQAIIACALERYHLAHGEYPEKLDALLPQFLAAIPHDVIGGKPPHYHRSANGSFTLYSIGWTGIDHGGVPGKTISDGDWVWLAFL